MTLGSFPFWREKRANKARNPGKKEQVATKRRTVARRIDGEELAGAGFVKKAGRAGHKRGGATHKQFKLEGRRVKSMGGGATKSQHGELKP